MADLWEPVSGVFWGVAPLLPSLAWLDKLSDSSFFITVFGASVGAGFGAWAASRIAKKSKLIDVVTEEVRANNLAMILAQQTFNLSLSLKVKAVKPMTEAYNEEVRAFQEKNSSSSSSRTSKGRNLEKIGQINPPIEVLRTIALERLTLSGPATRAVLAIVESAHCLSRALTTRNELTDIFLHQQFPPGQDFEHMYFGVSKDGACHAGYKQSMDSMTKSTDDMLFFSMTLCQLLDDHGVQLRKECKKLVRGKVSINRFRLLDTIPDGVIPDKKAYAAWFAGYEPTVNNKKWWHLRRK